MQFICVLEDNPSVEYIKHLGENWYYNLHISSRWEPFLNVKDTLESINEIVYADFMSDASDGRGIYVFGNGILCENLTGRTLLLPDELADAFQTFLSSSNYVFDGIWVSEHRIAYEFGLGKYQYVHTFNGKPPSYYTGGDRDERFSKQRLIDNWFYTSW